jgi:hypothetical protein
MTLECVIWSFDHSMWWRAHRQGYTEDFAEAGRYLPAEAGEIMADDVMCDTLPIPVDVARTQGAPTWHPYNGLGR